MGWDVWGKSGDFNLFAYLVVTNRAETSHDRFYRWIWGWGVGEGEGGKVEGEGGKSGERGTGKSEAGGKH